MQNKDSKSFQSISKNTRTKTEIITKKSLQTRCQEYLDIGPPTIMENYIPGSLTEVFIFHGANNKIIDSDLMKLGSLILLESSDYENSDKDIQIKNYLITGARLVKEIMKN